MKKTQEKQYISSSDAISVFLVIGLCILLLLPAWNNGSNDRIEFTMHRAESLAYQIVEVRYGTQREPANEAEIALNQLFLDEGVIGSDTWGRPFRFKIIKNNSHHSRVLVWSLGPNGDDESSDAKHDLKQGNGPLIMAGDDLGVMVPIN